MGELHNTYIDSACNCIAHALNTLDALMDMRHTTLDRMLIIMASIFALVALMGAASATDYYVATWGDNTAQGNITHPWQNVSYATQQAVAGDTIHLFDGTWYDEHATFANSGNATHPITLTAYNGTPTMDGVDKTGSGIRINLKDHIKIKHLTIRKYLHTIADPGSYIHISDCDLSDTGGVVMAISLANSNHNTIENCTLYDSGWNTIQMSANREPPDGNGIPSTYITVRNCTIYNSTKHNAIDLYGNLQNVTIEDNEFYSNPAGCIYEHDDPDHREYVTIRDNYFHDTQSSAINIGANSYYEIYNNTFENIPSNNVMYLYCGAHDYEIYNNSFYNCMSPRTIGGYNFVFDRNYMHTDSSVYTISHGSNGTVRNPLGRQQLIVKFDNSTADMEFDDGTVFTATFGGASEYTPVRYYPDKSNCSITAAKYDQHTLTPTTYNITLHPTCGHLYDVTVDTWDEATDTYRITASSTESENPTWINLTTKAASTTYNIKRDDESYDTQATTSADGVLRYRCNDAWDGPRTFEFSYASGGVDPAPCVTDLRNDPPAQDTVTLRWDCLAPDIDHYNIYRDGAFLANTGNKYYSANNLAPNTTYTFSVSATNTAGITGDSVSITVRAAAEDFGSNTVHIADDVTAAHGGSVTVPIMIYNATGVACAGVALTYDASVVTVTHVTGGCFTSYIDFDEGHVADGQMILNTYINGTQLTGEAKVADVTFVAVGEAGDTSPLDMEIIAMADQDGYPVTGTVSNGLFTVVSDTSPPIATDPSASQLIPDDTDGVPLWGETATLNITVTDESDIASVTIDLSAIGGSPVQPMTPIGGNVWSVTTSASAGTSPQTYELQVCATDIHGYTNMSESVELVVMRNGDVTGDGDVKLNDVILLGNCVTHPDRQSLSSEFVADVTGDGVVDIADAMLLANHVVRPDRYTLR